MIGSGIDTGASGDAAGVSRGSGVVGGTAGAPVVTPGRSAAADAVIRGTSGRGASGRVGADRAGSGRPPAGPAVPSRAGSSRPASDRPADPVGDAVLSSAARSTVCGVAAGGPAIVDAGEASVADGGLAASTRVVGSLVAG
jgi:hypothetical protein